MRPSRPHQVKENFLNEEGAVDLASIMVGIIAIGIIAGVVAATIFAVIPWAQDRSAKAQLDSVTTAESAYSGLKPGKFTADLGTLLDSKAANVKIRSNENDSYLAFVKSSSGKYFYTTNSQTKPTEVPSPWPTTAPIGVPANVDWPTSVDNFTNAGTAITNLNPTPLGDSWDTNRWFGGGSSDGKYTVIDTSATTPWATAARKTWTVASPQQGDTGFDSSPRIPITAGKTYTASGWLRSSVPQNGGEVFYWYDDNGNQVSRTNGQPVSLKKDQWTRVYDTQKAPAGATNLIIITDVYYNNTVNQWKPGDTLDGTASMLTEGTTLWTYSDGNTSGWTWKGATGNSTSSGKSVF